MECDKRVGEDAVARTLLLGALIDAERDVAATVARLGRE